MLTFLACLSQVTNEGKHGRGVWQTTLPYEPGLIMLSFVFIRTTLFVTLNISETSLCHVLTILFNDNKPLIKTSLFESFSMIMTTIREVIPQLVFRCVLTNLGVLQIGIRAIIIENQVYFHNTGL